MAVALADGMGGGMAAATESETVKLTVIGLGGAKKEVSVERGATLRRAVTLALGADAMKEGVAAMLHPCEVLDPNDGRPMRAVLGARTNVTLDTLLDEEQLIRAMVLRDDEEWSRVDADSTLESLNAVVSNTVRLVDPSKEFTVMVKTLTGRTVPLRVLPQTLVSEFKEMFRQAEGVPVDQQRVIYAGKQLEDDRTLAAYSLNGTQESAPEIHMVLRLRGGMYMPSSGRDQLDHLQRVRTSTVTVLTGQGSMRVELGVGESVCELIARVNTQLMLERSQARGHPLAADALSTDELFAVEALFGALAESNEGDDEAQAGQQGDDDVARGFGLFD